MTHLLLLFAGCLLFPLITLAQFPAICNTEQNLQSKTCCPNDCGSPTRGTCQNVRAEVITQWTQADSTVRELLRDAPNNLEKGTADARYLWPTVVFENVCRCNGNYGGYDCNECDFGWTGDDCATRKPIVIRKSFSRLTAEEQRKVVEATLNLKNDVGRWSVVVDEPPNYMSGTVTLQNVSTYDFFIYLHAYTARADACNSSVNDNTTIDFAHQGPVFPVWHRRYLLIVEREFQRITNNDSFGLPYWQWEEDDRSPFTEENYGVPSNSYGSVVNVSGQVINTSSWNTVCDLEYRNDALNCSSYWKPCNPANDLAERNPLQRGGGSTYLPNSIEVKIAIAAPYYDASAADGQYNTLSPRESFRNRMEGWNMICSAAICTGDGGNRSHVHNVVHIWVGGHMLVVPASINDPVFNLHHCNVDRILESWMQRFANGRLNPHLLPPYVPKEKGHPGHNRDDYIVPFFPLVTAGEQYSVAEEWGYTYDELILADISDATIANCSSVLAPGSCPICDANTTCIHCTNEMCPNITTPTDLTTTIAETTTESLAFPLEFGLGIRILFLITICIVITVSVIFFCYMWDTKQELNKLWVSEGDANGYLSVKTQNKFQCQPELVS